MLRNKEYPFILADVDRLVVGENAFLECKTTASWKEEEWDGDNLPDAYYLQLQQTYPYLLHAMDYTLILSLMATIFSQFVQNSNQYTIDNTQEQIHTNTQATYHKHKVYIKALLP